MSKIQNRNEVKKMLNQCTLTGNLGGDPEVFYSSEGNPVSSFSLAFHSSKKKTGWIKVTCFQKLAEVAGKYLHKGARIALIGTLDQHRWETDEGIQRISFQLITNTLEFIKTDGRGFKEGQTEEKEIPYSELKRFPRFVFVDPSPICEPPWLTPTIRVFLNQGLA